jgi:hypothetical protein
MLLSALREWDRQIGFLCAGHVGDLCLSDTDIAGCIAEYFTGMGYENHYQAIGAIPQVLVNHPVRNIRVWLRFAVFTHSSWFTIKCYDPEGFLFATPRDISSGFSKAHCVQAIKGMFAFLDLPPQEVD